MRGRERAARKAKEGGPPPSLGGQACDFIDRRDIAHAKVDDPHGPDNARHIVQAIGAHLGLTVHGHPRHPLYVRANEPLKDWC